MVWWNKSSGNTLVEVLVVLAVFGIVASALFSLFASGLRVLNDDQNRSTALAIANKKLEVIKNLPYDDVGTSGGVPSGSLLATETESLNNVSFTITTDIRYVDDSFDALAPTDTLNTDYKRVHLTVSWPNSTTPVYLVTNIVPTAVESTATGGTLWIEVYDPTTDPIAAIKNATVTVNAPTVSPAVSLTSKTDGDGRLILPGMPPGIEAYEITVTKQNYSTAQTYATDPATNPNPNPPHLNVVAGEVTTAYFEISQKVNLLAWHLNHIVDNGPLDITFQLHGEATIGTDGAGQPIYKYNETIGPNPGGNAEIHDLETDSYSARFDEAAIGYVVAGITEQLPYPALPQSSQTITVYFDDYQPFTALLTVTDPTGTVLADATVSITDPATSAVTSLQTTSYGQAWFNNLTATTYDLTISLTGYTTHTGSVIVNGNEQQTFSLPIAS